MRILLVQHGSPEELPAGPTNVRLANELTSLGHEVRVLEIAEAVAAQAFATLTDAQLAEYRATLRDLLDEMMHAFNPHVVHVQHLWVLAHLALESGVPYVAQVWGPELTLADADPRYRPLVEQAAENAGRILVEDAHMAAEVQGRFDIAAERVIVTPATDAANLAKLYETVLVERYGRVPG